MNLPIKIKLPEGFLKEEVRCGYTVSPKLKQIWAVQLDLMQRFQEVCRKYDIHYSIYWGSLLGAVRHKGFIPWDDDFDVIVDRKGFNKLCRIPQSEFGEPYFFQTALSDRARFCPYGRFRNSLTTGVITGDETADYNNGIYIDVYVFDGVAPNRFWLTIQCFFMHLTLLPLLARCECVGRRRLIHSLVRPFSLALPYRFWWWAYVRVVSFFTPFTDKIGAAYSFKPQDHFDYWVEKSQFTKTESVPFEFIFVDAIFMREDFLVRRYQDFMQFPPAEQRGKWHEGQIHYEPVVPYKQFLRGK